MRKKALCVALLWIILLVVVFVFYLLRGISPVKEFIAWALSVWQILAALFAGAVLFSGWIIRHDFSRPKKGVATKTSLDLIVPKVQVTPADILDDDIATTTMIIYILNYSEHTAKNISVDIKFGDSLWKHDLRKAASIELNNKLLAGRDDPLMAEILSKTSEQEVREMLKKYLDHPILDELKPGIKYKVGIIDVNKDWVLKQKMFFVSGGKATPIKPEESTDYQESQGWKERIENTESGKPIKILLHTVWGNEIGKTFDQIVEHQLICTKIGTGRSYTFLPTGGVIGDP